jgi:hypothetical protein
LAQDRKGRTIMALKTYSASCHCGAVRFEADLDLAKGTVRCNCSLCAKARAWLVFAPGGQLRPGPGADTQAHYQWTPPGKPHPFLHYHFCGTCGVRTYGHAEMESMGGLFYAVNVAALDGVDIDELAAAPIQYVDGRHDRFQSAPEDTRTL